MKKFDIDPNKTKDLFDSLREIPEWDSDITFDNFLFLLANNPKFALFFHKHVNLSKLDKSDQFIDFVSDCYFKADLISLLSTITPNKNIKFSFDDFSYYELDYVVMDYLSILKNHIPSYISYITKEMIETVLINNPCLYYESLCNTSSDSVPRDAMIYFLFVYYTGSDMPNISDLNHKTLAIEKLKEQKLMF